MVSGDTRWENMLQRSSATRRVRCKHGSNVEPWSCCIGTAFCDDVAQMTDLFQNYLDHPRQFGSVMDLCANDPRSISIAHPQLDTGPFVDFVKRIEASPATECACERLFCQLHNLVGDFGTKCVTLWLSICRWSKQESYGQAVYTSKNTPTFSEGPVKCNQTQNHINRLFNIGIAGKGFSFQSPAITFDTQWWKQS
jgi:hypothetical protein